MAWPSVTVTSGGSAVTGTGTGTLTFSHTCAAGDTKIVVAIGSGRTGGADSVTGVTYAGSALTNITNQSDGSFERAQLWQLNSPTTGSAQNVVISYDSGASNTQIGYGAISFDSAAASVGTPSSATGATANPSVTVADSASGDIVVSVVANDNAANAQSPSTGTVIFDFDDVGADSDFTAQYQTASGANTVCTFTQSDTTGGNWVIVGVAIKSAAPTGPTINTQPTNQRVRVGDTASYSVSATASGGSLTYQWQSNATGSWVNITGETASSYTTGALAASLAYAVRCNVTDSNGTTATNPADLWTPVASPTPWSGLYGRTLEDRDAVELTPYTAVRDFVLLQPFYGTSAAGPATVNAAPGTWAWVGTNAAVPTQISATPAAYTWSGATATTNQVLSAIFGAWNWAGTAATISQLVNQTAGAWSWAGTAASVTQLVSATPGTWAWVGATASTSQLVSASPGAWSWAGATATIPAGAINAVPGAWSWAGTTATFPAAGINATPGTWSWSGTTAEVPAQIQALAGAWSWAGATATLAAPSLDATPGVWSWAGTAQQIIQTATVDAVPATWTWGGATSSISGGEAQSTGAGRSRRVALERRGRAYLFDSEEAAAAWLAAEEPAEQRKVEKAAKTVAKRVSGLNEIAALKFEPVIATDAPQSIKAMAQIQAEILTGQFKAAVRQAYDRRIEAELARADEEETSAILMALLME